MEIVDFSISSGRIDGLVIITMKQITDERGTIRELFRQSAFQEVGIDLARFRQLNVTETRRGAVRGMHAEEMTKLLAIGAGSAFGAYVDMRPQSPTFGVVETIDLSPGVQVLVPAGVANGFQSLSDPSQYVYCFDVEWAPDLPGRACTPLDRDLAIEWPIRIDPNNPAQISLKDRDAPTWATIAAAR